MEKSKWAYKIKVTPATRGYFPDVYKCPKCHVEYQTTPPSHLIGQSMEVLCPDCGGSYNEMPEGFGISDEGFTQSLETIKEDRDHKKSVEEYDNLPWYRKLLKERPVHPCLKRL